MNIESEINELKERLIVLENMIKGVSSTNVAMSELLQKYKMNNQSSDNTTTDSSSTQEEKTIQPGMIISLIKWKWYVIDREGKTISGPWIKKKDLLEKLSINRTRRLGDGNYEVLK